MSAEQYEQLRKDYRFVVGIDEVGLGAWAGPLYVTACLVGAAFYYPGLRDSKALSENWREKNYTRLVDAIGGSANLCTAVRSCRTIDKKGVQFALTDAIYEVQLHMIRLMERSGCQALFVMDGDHEIPVPPAIGIARSWPKADTFVPACMVAANVAKTLRDRYMRATLEDNEKNRLFGFDKNKGYGSRQHQEALMQHGITKEHRVSYRPVKEWLYANKEATLEDRQEEAEPDG